MEYVSNIDIVAKIDDEGTVAERFNDEFIRMFSERNEWLAIIESGEGTEYHIERWMDCHGGIAYLCNLMGDNTYGMLSPKMFTPPSFAAHAKYDFRQRISGILLGGPFVECLLVEHASAVAMTVRLDGLIRSIMGI